MQSAGQVFAHLPHPTHRSLLTKEKQPFITDIACLGQTLVQAPQATQMSLETSATFLDAMLSSLSRIKKLPSCIKGSF